MTKPKSVRQLDSIIRRIWGTDNHVAIRTLIANAIVASMLPNGVAKGGSALKMRLGSSQTRFTRDLDTAAVGSCSEYIACLSSRLEEGWEGFTGHIVERKPPSPEGVPDAYVMRPFDVKLSYLGRPWCTVPLEVGANEIGAAAEPEWVEIADVDDMLLELGFSALNRIPMMSAHYQVAQKLHALTSLGDRARDLVDLQLIARNMTVDTAEVRTTCQRLFASRRAQAWPPKLAVQPGWDKLYAESAKGLPVLQDVGSAVEWCNGFIDEIEHTGLELEGSMEEAALESGDDRIAAARAKAASVNGLQEHQSKSRGKSHGGPEL